MQRMRDRLGVSLLLWSVLSTGVCHNSRRASITMKPVPMFLSALLLGPPVALCAASNDVLWIEAEDYSQQRGSRAAHFAMTSAWGGACVDNDWGSREGDFLRYRLELPTEFPTLCVTLRYARQTAGESVVRVTLDGDAHQSAIVKLPATASPTTRRMRRRPGSGRTN